MMNTAIIGQVADFSQNKLGSKPGKTSGESPAGESFSEVFAESSRATPEAEQPEVSEAQGAVPGPEAAEENVEASDDQTDEPHTEDDVAALLPAEAAATPAGQASADDNSVLERSGASQEDAESAVTSSVLETGAPEGGELETQAGADGTGQPTGEGLPLAGAGSGEQRAQQSAASGNGLESTAKASVPTEGQSQANGIANDGRVQPQPGAQQRIAGVGETPANGPVTSQQPIGAGLTQAEVHAELARTATGSIEDLPLVYRVRLGALSPAAQQAIYEGAPSAAPAAAPAAPAAAPAAPAAAPTVPAVTPVSPVAAAVQNELALRQASDPGSGLVANASIDLPEGVELVELEGVELSEPATASKTLAAAPTAVAAAVSVNTPRPNPAGSRAEKASEAQLDEISTEEIVEDARLPGEVTRERGAVGATQVSQSALLAQIGQAQNNERFGHGAQQDFRLGPQAIGITQSLTEATFRPATIPTPEVAQRIAVQLTEAFASKGERKVEVMLNPKELGQVKMQLSTSENGVRVIIHAERSETGDLMRRHISALENEFKDMGFENISFSFSSGDSQSQSGGNNQSDGSARHGQATADEIETAPVGQHLNLGGSGLDMRV